MDLNIKSNKKLTVSQMRSNAASAELLLKQLANANRVMVLCYLVEGEKTVGDLANSVGLSHSSLSQHLSKLKKAGIVSSEKRGLMVYYRICSIEAQTLLSVLHLIYCR